jgi:cell division protein FtsB
VQYAERLPAAICLLPTDYRRNAHCLARERASSPPARPVWSTCSTGFIKVSLANVELLTLQIRLLVCSIDKAEQIGLNWWRYDTNLTTRAAVAEAENVELRERVAALEREIRQLNEAPARTEGAVRGDAKGSKPRPARKRNE